MGLFSKYLVHLQQITARDSFTNLLRGYSLKDGIDAPLDELQKYYLGKAYNALTSALKDLHKQYKLKHNKL